MTNHKGWKFHTTARNTTKNPKRVEVRKTINGAQVLLYVAKDGWYAGKYEHANNTKGKNIRLSMNGAAKMTFDELADMYEAIMIAKAML